MNGLTMRESFEVWAISNGFAVEFQRGEYTHPHTQSAWEGWQGANAGEELEDPQPAASALPDTGNVGAIPVVVGPGVLCSICGLGRHVACHRPLLSGPNAGEPLDHVFTVDTVAGVVRLPPLPKPDITAFDEDTETWVRSFSDELMDDHARAAVALNAAALPPPGRGMVPMTEEEFPVNWDAVPEPHSSQSYAPSVLKWHSFANRCYACQGPCTLRKAAIRALGLKEGS